MVPEMLKQGYGKAFSYSLIAAAGILGIIIPPSIPMVMYGVATMESIGTMFLGGFGPGIVAGIFLILMAVHISKKNGYVGNGLSSAGSGLFIPGGMPSLRWWFQSSFWAVFTADFLQPLKPLQWP